MAGRAAASAGSDAPARKRGVGEREQPRRGRPRHTRDAGAGRARNRGGRRLRDGARRPRRRRCVGGAVSGRGSRLRGNDGDKGARFPPTRERRDRGGDGSRLRGNDGARGAGFPPTRSGRWGDVRLSLAAGGGRRRARCGEADRRQFGLGREAVHGRRPRVRLARRGRRPHSRSGAPYAGGGRRGEPRHWSLRGGAAAGVRGRSDALQHRRAGDGGLRHGAGDHSGGVGVGEAAARLLHGDAPVDAGGRA